MTSKRPDKNQQHFHFHFAAEDLAPPADAGSRDELSPFERRLRLILREVLEDVAGRALDPLDRFEVAARMSRKLGREISKSHLDGWIALSAVQRRIHADSLKALCDVTGDWRALHYFAESCGFKAMNREEALCAEFGKLMLMEKEFATARRDLLASSDVKAIRSSLLGRLSIKDIKGGRG